MYWEISSPRTESGIYVHQSVEHMFLARGQLYDTLPKECIENHSQGCY